MTNIEIIKAVAELDGTEYHKPTQNEINSGSYYQYEPNYLTSLDAIVPVIEKQDEWTQRHFIEALQDTTEEISVIKLFLATPRQLCEALLKSVGKWKG